MSINEESTICEISSIINDEYKKRNYGLSSCASRYSINLVKEAELKIFMRHQNIDCDRPNSRMNITYVINDCSVTNIIDSFVCPTLTNVQSTNNQNGSISISFSTNNSNGVFKCSIDNGELLPILTNPFSITGLSNGTHIVSIKALKPDNTICNHSDITVNISITQVPIYYIASTTNTLPTSDEILTWNTSNVNTGENITIPFQNYNSAPKFLKFAELATEPEKVSYYFSQDDQGDLGSDSTWNLGQIVGIYRVYMPNYQTQTDNLPAQFKVATIG